MKAMNKTLAMLATAALAACMFPMFLSAEQPPEEDIWAKVTSLDQLDGTWAESEITTMSVKERAGSTWNSAMENMFGTDAKITIFVTLTFTINASAKTREGTKTVTYTFSGSNTIANWPVIRAVAERAISDFALSNLSLTYSIDDSTHSFTVAQTFAPSPVGSDIDRFLALLEINQDGTKLRQPAAGESPEIIYTRQ
jgi:hypothetical protein